MTLPTFNIPNKIHDTRLYSIWEGLVQRCCNVKCKEYQRYGAIGRGLCDEWRNSSRAFYAWAIENGYNDSLSLERIDNSKGYSPDNCKWANRRTQNVNKVNNRVILYKGEQMTLTELCEKTHKNFKMLSARLEAGWPLDEALSFGPNARPTKRFKLSSDVLVVGVDPGKFGCFALVDNYNVELHDMPLTDEEYYKKLQEFAFKGTRSRFKKIKVYFEDVHALPNQSTVAGFTFGKNVGKAELLSQSFCDVDCFEFIKVTPQKWKKYFGLDKDKKKSIELAKKLFPDVSKFLTASKDGRAEALLIAEYGRNN